MNKPLPMPRFNNEDDEREFWATHSAVDYFDLSKAQRVTFPNLKPSTQTISLRLPLGLLDNIRALANKKDVPYQSLIKVMLDRQVQDEMHSATR